MTDLTGYTIGQVQILEEIGRGGMATVYRAYQASMDRNVAIKILPPQFTHSQSFLARFEREARIAAQVQHPRILPVYDVGEYEGMPYIVMAYMPGGTLEDEIERYAPEGMPLAVVLHYAEQIAEGLDALHAAGVVHRDLKPSNVLIDEHGDLHLGDFGIAKVQEVTSPLTGTGILGTPAYMAPEVFQESDVTSASDIYAFGIMLYEMLVGHPPFDADTPVQWMRVHLEHQPPALSTLRSDLPETVDFVFQTALAKTPGARYGAASGLVDALRRALPATEPQLPATEPQLPAPRGQQAFPWWWAVIGIALVTLVIGAGLFIFNNAGKVPAETTPLAEKPPSPTITTRPTEQPSQSVPTVSTMDEPTPPPEATVAIDIPIIGGGTGMLGFNIDELGYVVDVSCVMSGEQDCDSNPHILPEIGGITPLFGQWSPDGASVVFEVNTTEDVFDMPEDNQIYVVDLSGNHLIQIEDKRNSYNPIWSPDSQQVAYLSQGDVYVTDISCQEIHCIKSGDLIFDYHGTFQTVDPLLYGWWPGNILIANPEIWYTIHDKPTALPGFSTISPDGSNLQFFAERLGWHIPDTNYHILTERSDTITVVRITDMETGTSWPIMSVENMNNVNVGVLSDRILLAFTSTSNDLDPGELFIADIATCYQSGHMGCQETITQITDNERTENYLSFSPDGKWLALIISETSEVRTVERCRRHWDPSQPPDWNCGFLDVVASLDGDIYLLNIDQALSGDGQESFTRITNLRFANWGFRDQENPTLFEAFNPTWQPYPEN